ncbi:MAG: SYNERG-CTERM sorting domain-containing protein, partial [Cloacibacillus porcorum]|nr:SYNERG-CTERM sorting domain-containing protein [Cloacibacillus porcorum]
RANDLPKYHNSSTKNFMYPPPTKSNHKLLYLLILLLISFSSTIGYAPAWAEGTEPISKDNVYQIGTADELVWFRDSINSGDIPASSDAKLTANIDLTRAGGQPSRWQPIGGAFNGKEHYYEGTFDGCGHSVKGYTVTSADMVDIYDRKAAGFFGVLSNGATVKRLTLLGDVNVASVVSIYAGGFAGITYNSTITNCTYSAIINVSNSGGMGFVGGFVGYPHGGKIVNCIYSGTGGVTSQANYYTGGFVGCSEGCTIINCTYSSTGGISISGDIAAYDGGFVGENYGTIINCVFSGAGIVSASGCDKVGGLVGVNHGTITNCGWLNTAASEDVGLNNGGNKTDVVSLDSKEFTRIVTTILLNETTVAEGASTEVNFTTYPGKPDDIAKYFTIISADTSDNAVATIAAGKSGIIVSGLKAGVTEILAFVKLNTFNFKDKTISENTPIETELISPVTVEAEPISPIPPTPPIQPTTPQPHSGGSSGCNMGTTAIVLLALLPLLYRKKR